MHTLSFAGFPVGVAAIGLAIAALGPAGPATGQTTPVAAYVTLQPVMQRLARPATGAADDVEMRIKSLHARLQITSGEEAHWSAVAEIMRDDALRMRATTPHDNDEQRATAIGELRRYQALANAHMHALNRLIPAFQGLYNCMPYAQRIRVDALLGGGGRGRVARSNSALGRSVPLQHCAYSPHAGAKPAPRSVSAR